MENVLTDLGEVILQGKCVDYLGCVHHEGSVEKLTLYEKYVKYRTQGLFDYQDYEDNIPVGVVGEKKFDTCIIILKKDIGSVRAVWHRPDESWYMEILGGGTTISIPTATRKSAHELQQKILQWLIS
jgi:hypothetical protein